MDIKENIGKRITLSRKELAITIKELAARTGSLSAARISNWEQGTRSPGPMEAKSLAGVLGVSASYLLCLSDDPRGDITLRSDVFPRYAPIIPLEETHLSKSKLQKLIHDAASFSNDINKVSIENKTKQIAGPNAFATTIEDTSMSPSFSPNDIVIADPDIKPRPGQYVIARIKSSNNNIIRKYREINASKSGGFELVALNTDWGNTHVDNLKEGVIIATIVEHRNYY